jgi:hypothetical protein
MSRFSDGWTVTLSLSHTLSSSYARYGECIEGVGAIDSTISTSVTRNRYRSSNSRNCRNSRNASNSVVRKFRHIEAAV